MIKKEGLNSFHKNTFPVSLDPESSFVRGKFIPLFVSMFFSIVPFFSSSPYAKIANGDNDGDVKVI